MVIKDKISDHLYRLATSEAMRLKDSKNGGQYERFLSLFNAPFDELQQKIADLPNLVDIDACPPEFLPYLAELVGYEYNHTLPAEPQRAAIKSITNIYKKKGTPGSYVDLLAPFDPYASYYEPFANVARYSVSKFSGKDHYQDGEYWRTGVFEIQSDALNMPGIREKLVENRPAGKKIWLLFRAYMDFNDAPEGYAGFIHREEYIQNTLIIEPKVTGSVIGNVFSSSMAQNLRARSGRQILFGVNAFYWTEIPPQSFLRGHDIDILPSHEMPENYAVVKAEKKDPGIFSQQKGVLSGDLVRSHDKYPIPIDPYARASYQPPVDTDVIHVRPPQRSSTASFSGRFRLSGAYNGGWQDKPFILVADKFLVNHTMVSSVEKTTVFMEWKVDAQQGNKNVEGQHIVYTEALAEAHEITFADGGTTVEVESTVLGEFDNTERVVSTVLSLEAEARHDSPNTYHTEINSTLELPSAYVGRYIIGSVLYTPNDLVGATDKEVTVESRIDYQGEVEIILS